MKLSSAFTFQYMIFIGMIMLLNPAKLLPSNLPADEIKIEKKQIEVVANTSIELLPCDILFKY